MQYLEMTCSPITIERESQFFAKRLVYIKE
jgi:hypothetical protein